MSSSRNAPVTDQALNHVLIALLQDLIAASDANDGDSIANVINSAREIIEQNKP